MNEQATNPNDAGERCLCREVFEQIRATLGVPPGVVEHLTNARVELLKAVRAGLDARIARLEQSGAAGAHIKVE